MPTSQLKNNVKFESWWLAFSLIAGSLAGKCTMYRVYGVRRQPNRTSYTFRFLSNPVHRTPYIISDKSLYSKLESNTLHSNQCLKI